MEEYKQYLFSTIYNPRYKTIEEVENGIKHSTEFTINRNEEGKIHSRYLRNRYEPAIIKQSGDYTHKYYLFDGDIKDCMHPFCVMYKRGEIVYVRYYSSERMKNGEPIYINRNSITKPNGLERFTLLCDEIEWEPTLKFAD